MSHLNNNIDGQLKDQLQKLVVEINELEDKLAKVSKAKERKKLQKTLDEKKEAYKLLTESSMQQENTPAASEESPAASEETPAPEETPKDSTSTPEDTPKVPEAPKVSAKDTAPAPDNKPTVGMSQDNDENPTKWFSVSVYSILAVVLGFVAWWYLYTDTTAVANTVVYERATAQLKEDIQPKWYRWHSWDLEVKGEAILEWMPAYKAVFVDGGNTSSKGEATLYAVGCAIRALTKKGMSVGDAAEKVDVMSNMQLRNLLDDDVTLTASEVRAIKRALDN